MNKHEYRFRAWHKEKEYMYYNLAVGLDGKVLYSRGNPKKKGADWYVSEEYDENIIIMEFIGLKAAEDIEIFEGDILKIGAQKNLAKVSWNPENARYELKFLEDGRVIGLDDKRSLRNLSVMGNIFENPELIGKGKETQKKK